MYNARGLPYGECGAPAQPYTQLIKALNEQPI
jgi:hypothetical protein